MKITVFGASGGVGKHIVDFALDRGHSVVGIYRNPPQILHANFRAVLAKDILDPSVVRESILNSTAIASAIGLRRRHPNNPWSPLISPPDLTSRFAKVLVEALGGARPQPRVVAISAGGVGDSWNRVNPVFRFLVEKSNIGIAYKNLNAMESIYRDSQLDWWCVRPTTLNNRSVRHQPRLVSYYGLMSQISRQQVATYVLDLIENKIQPETRTPMISG